MAKNRIMQYLDALHTFFTCFSPPMRVLEKCAGMATRTFGNCPHKTDQKPRPEFFPTPILKSEFSASPIFLPTEISNPKTAAATRPSGERGTACGGEPHLKALLLSPRKKCFGSFQKEQAERSEARIKTEGSLLKVLCLYCTLTTPYRYETVPYRSLPFPTVTKQYPTLRKVTKQYASL